MSEFTLNQKIGAINAIRKNCDRAVRECGLSCPVGGICDSVIKSIEDDLRFADAHMTVCNQHEH